MSKSTNHVGPEGYDKETHPSLKEQLIEDNPKTLSKGSLMESQSLINKGHKTTLQMPKHASNANVGAPRKHATI